MQVFVDSTKFVMHLLQVSLLTFDLYLCCMDIFALVVAFQKGRLQIPGADIVVLPA